MASVFGISDLPVANPFPFLAKALEVEDEVVYVKPVKFVDDIPDKDVFVSKTRQVINEYLAKVNKKRNNTVEEVKIEFGSILDKTLVNYLR